MFSEKNYHCSDTPSTFGVNPGCATTTFPPPIPHLWRLNFFKTSFRDIFRKKLAKYRAPGPTTELWHSCEKLCTFGMENSDGSRVSPTGDINPKGGEANPLFVPKTKKERKWTWPPLLLDLLVDLHCNRNSWANCKYECVLLVQYNPLLKD